MAFEFCKENLTLATRISIHQFLQNVAELRVFREMVSLGSIGFIRDPSNSFNIFRGEPDLPSVHIFLEALRNLHFLSKGSRLI